MGFGKAAKWSSGKESRAAKAQKRAAKAKPLLDDVADGADGEAAAARPASAQAQPQPRRTAHRAGRSVALPSLSYPLLAVLLPPSRSGRRP